MGIAHVRNTSHSPAQQAEFPPLQTLYACRIRVGWLSREWRMSGVLPLRNEELANLYIRQRFLKIRF